MVREGHRRRQEHMERMLQDFKAKLEDHNTGRVILGPNEEETLKQRIQLFERNIRDHRHFDTKLALDEMRNARFKEHLNEHDERRRRMEQERFERHRRERERRRDLGQDEF